MSENNETRMESVGLSMLRHQNYIDVTFSGGITPQDEKKKFNWDKFWRNFIILGVGIAWTVFNLLTLETG